MTKSNPLSKIVKEGDIVLIELEGMRYNSPISRQICRLKNLKYEPADEKYNFDWLYFEVDVLYTSMRTHPSLLNECVGNCLAIKEIIPEGIADMYAKNHNMWPATEFMLSDEELEAMYEQLNNDIQDIK